MAWNDIKQWFANMIPSSGDFNRIEGNTLDNHERLNSIEDGPLTKILGRQVEWVEYALFNLFSSIPSPGEYPRDLAWDGINLWNADSSADRIYKLNTLGTILS